MTNILEESKKADLDRKLKELQQQRLVHMKEMEKWDISNNVSDTAINSLKNKKYHYKNRVKNNSETISKDLNKGLDELHTYIKGKIISGMKEAYSKEDKKLMEL